MTCKAYILSNKSNQTSVAQLIGALLSLLCKVFDYGGTNREGDFNIISLSNDLVSV